MGAIDEIIEAPLSPQALGARFRELCDDPRFANLPGKIELDVWGRIVMSPASNLHGLLKMRLGQRLAPLGGQAFAEASVLTPSGVLVADVAWGSAELVRAHRAETPFTRAPELCIEVVSPSNARKELEEKIAAYLAAGAKEGPRRSGSCCRSRSASRSSARTVRSRRRPTRSTLRGCSTSERSVPRRLCAASITPPRPSPWEPPARGRVENRRPRV